MNFPIVDGHFWIVRDGKIIDWDFKDSEYIMKRTFHCSNKKLYLPAPAITQKIMITMFKKVVINSFEKPTWEEALKDMYELALTVGATGPEDRRCFNNCIFEIYQNGGELVFGSIGYKFKNKDGYHYEFGGENYKVIKDFIR